MKDNRLIAPLNCEGCGAPLPSSLKCDYCGTRHERVDRYRGPEVPETFTPTPWGMVTGSSMTITAASYLNSWSVYRTNGVDIYGG